MQNSPNDLNPAKQMSAQISKDLTIAQVASPLLKAEAGNDNTVSQILPKLSPQYSHPAAALVNHVSLSPPKPGVVEQIGSSSKPTRTVEAESLTPNPIDNTIVQYSDSTMQNLTDQTVVQYSDSAIHNPADRTVHQAMLPLSIELDRTVHQLGRPQPSQSSTLTVVPTNRAHIQLFQPSIFRDTFRATGSFTSRFISITGQFFDSIWRKIDLKQLQSRFHSGRQLATVKTLARTSSSHINRSTHNAMASEEQPSLEQYQKKLRELDLCRLSFAKELARNGKFRQAITMAKQISETSHFFKDAQMLIRSWK